MQNVHVRQCVLVCMENWIENHYVVLFLLTIFFLINAITGATYSIQEHHDLHLDLPPHLDTKNKGQDELVLLHLLAGSTAPL